jgi:hypothetical protein
MLPVFFLGKKIGAMIMHLCDLEAVPYQDLNSKYIFMLQVLKVINQRVHENVVTPKQLMLHSNLNSSLVLQLTPCMALYDTMLSLKSPIGTHCLGFAFNLAGFILAAGEKV